MFIIAIFIFISSKINFKSTYFIKAKTKKFSATISENQKICNDIRASFLNITNFDTLKTINLKSIEKINKIKPDEYLDKIQALINNNLKFIITKDNKKNYIQIKGKNNNEGNSLSLISANFPLKINMSTLYDNALRWEFEPNSMKFELNWGTNGKINIYRAKLILLSSNTDQILKEFIINSFIFDYNLRHLSSAKCDIVNHNNNPIQIIFSDLLSESPDKIDLGTLRNVKNPNFIIHTEHQFKQLSGLQSIQYKQKNQDKWIALTENEIKNLCKFRIKTLWKNIVLSLIKNEKNEHSIELSMEGRFTKNPVTGNPEKTLLKILIDNPILSILLTALMFIISNFKNLLDILEIKSQKNIKEQSR